MKNCSGKCDGKSKVYEELESLLDKYDKGDIKKEVENMDDDVYKKASEVLNSSESCRCEREVAGSVLSNKNVGKRKRGEVNEKK